MRAEVEARFAGTPSSICPTSLIAPQRSTSWIAAVPGTDAPLFDGRPNGRVPYTVPMPCIVASATKPGGAGASASASTAAAAKAKAAAPKAAAKPEEAKPAAPKRTKKAAKKAESREGTRQGRGAPRPPLHAHAREREGETHQTRHARLTARARRSSCLSCRVASRTRRHSGGCGLWTRNAHGADFSLLSG